MGIKAKVTTSLFADTTSLGLMSSLFDELLPHDEKMTAHHHTKYMFHTYVGIQK